MLSRYASVAIAVLALSAPAQTLVAIAPAETDANNRVDRVSAVTTDADKPAVPSAIDSAPQGNPLWGIPLKQLLFTRDRPIFSPSRRPPPPPVVSAPVVARVEHVEPKPPERPQLELIGTITGDGDQIGIFVERGTKQIVKLKAGEDYNGWLLQFVKGREVALHKNPETVAMELPAPSALAGPPPNPPAAAAPSSPMTPANAAPAIAASPAAASPPASAASADLPAPSGEPPPAAQNPLAALLQFRQTLTAATPATPASTPDHAQGLDALRKLVGTP